MRMQNGEVQILDFLIVTHPAFVEHSHVLKHVGLTSLALAKTKQNRFRNRAPAIAYGVAAAISLSDNLVVVRTVTKSQSRMRFQDVTTLGGFQRATHRISQTFC